MIAALLWIAGAHAQSLSDMPWTPLPSKPEPEPVIAPEDALGPVQPESVGPPSPESPLPDPPLPLIEPSIPAPPPPPNPLVNCRAGRSATDGQTFVHVTPDGELRAWGLADLQSRTGWQLASGCTSLVPWRGAFVCTNGKQPAVAWRDGVMSWALTELPRPVSQAVLTPGGDLIVDQPGGLPIEVKDPDGPGVQPGTLTPLQGLGRDVRSVAFDPTGTLVASLDGAGTLWVGFWPDRAQYAGVNLLDPGRAGDGDDPPRRVSFAGPNAVVVQTARGLWRRFLLVDPSLPVPLLLDEVPMKSGNAGATWIEPYGPLVAWQGIDGPTRILDPQGVRDWPHDRLSIAGAASWAGRLYAARCDGSLTVTPGLASAMPDPNRGLSKLVMEGHLAQAATTWQTIADRLLGDPSRVERLVRQIADALPIGAPLEGRSDGPVSATTFVDEATLILDRAEHEDLLHAPLATAASLLDKAESMATNAEGVPAARVRLEHLQFLKRERQLRLALSSGVLLGAAALLWRAVDRRRRARKRVIEAGHNPFRRDSPHDPARTPFAEHPLVEDVLRNLLQNCVVIEAPPFSGKSALLRHVVWRLEHEGLGGSPVRAAWLALKDVPEERFWTAVGHAFARAAIEFPDAAALLSEPNLDRFAVEVFLEDLWAWEGEVDLPRRVVLVLDDIDVLGRYTHENQRLRGLLQVIPGHRLTLLGAARSIRVGWEHGGADSPWFNIFQVRELAPLRGEDTARYVRRRLGPPFTVHPYVPAALHRRSGGRPLYLWHLAYATVEEALLLQTTAIKPEHVFAAERAIRELIELEASPLYEGEAAFEQALHSIAALRRRRDALLTQLSGAQPLGEEP